MESNAESVPTDVDQRWFWIRARLLEKKLRLSDVSTRLDVTLGNLCKAKYEHKPGFEKALAEAIDLTPEQIWPERYVVHDGTYETI